MAINDYGDVYDDDHNDDQFGNDNIFFPGFLGQGWNNENDDHDS